jgi:hypothetical protein
MIVTDACAGTDMHDDDSASLVGISVRCDGLL